MLHAVMGAHNYSLGLSLFIRGLGFAYFCAFFALARQALGLYGKDGILPIAENTRGRAATLFLLSQHDFYIVGLSLLGAFCAAMLFLGVWPSLMLPLVVVIYFSFVKAGGDFMAFQWDSMLIEVGVIGFFVALQNPAPLLMLLAIWVFLARFMISAGLVKIRSRDPNWRNLSAVHIHYQTQPLPNRIAWYMFQLPRRFHQLSALGMFAVELVVPFFIFWPGIPQVVAFGFLVALQVVLILTGNFSFLNYLVLALCFAIVPNTFWPSALNTLALPGFPLDLGLPLNVVGAFFFVVNLAQLWRLLWPRYWLSKLLAPLSRWHVCNAYGLFAVMTTTRYELIVEGSDDGITWQPYVFRYKPQDPLQAPKQIAPYQPRLDWQMWFAALEPASEPYWLRRFLHQLLKGSKPVLRLLFHNPFAQKPPTQIRVCIYEYRFTNWRERKRMGAYWERHFIATHHSWY